MTDAPLTDGPDLDAETGAAADADVVADVDVDVDRLDLDAVRRDLDDVQAALVRLDDGSYWTDEVTGEVIPDDVLIARPLARRTSPERSHH